MKFQNHDKSLFERIGGELGISSLIDRFYDRVVQDPEIGFYFTHVPIEKLKLMQREFFAMATGGPISYAGRPLSQVHRPLSISRRAFQRFTEHLISSLEEEGIDEKDVYDIIAKINLYADEITNESAVGD